MEQLSVNKDEMKNLFFFGSVVVGWFEFSSFWHILVV
jgi:hypothetical protein